MSELSCEPIIHNAIADSGTTGNYLPSTATVTHRTTATHPISVEVANGTVIKSTETGLLKNTALPLAARKVHLFPELNKALLSIGLFCDNGCDVLFNDTNVIVIDRKTKKELMRGGRDKISKLFMLDLDDASSSKTQQTNYSHLKPFAENLVYECKTKENLAIYLHQCCLCPPKRTWIAAIKRNFFAT